MSNKKNDDFGEDLDLQNSFEITDEDTIAIQQPISRNKPAPASGP
jgi:hypothetical protein